MCRSFACLACLSLSQSAAAPLDSTQIQFVEHPNALRRVSSEPSKIFVALLLGYNPARALSPSILHIHHYQHIQHASVLQQQNSDNANALVSPSQVPPRSRTGHIGMSGRGRWRRWLGADGSGGKLAVLGIVMDAIFIGALLQGPIALAKWLLQQLYHRPLTSNLLSFVTGGLLALSVTDPDIDDRMLPLCTRSSGMGKNKSGMPNVTFADLGGVDDAVRELTEIVDYFQNPQPYFAVGARMPRGVLLEGPPGTGKTLLARAIANEAGVNFVETDAAKLSSTSISGVAAENIRKLFRKAVKNAPSLMYIDEIDTLGRQRSSSSSEDSGGVVQDREAALNTLLVELDGFSCKTSPVVLLASTNRADLLDTALLRPGRFDRRVYVGLPDEKGRADILRVHARSKRLASAVSFDSLALQTKAFSGADLENLLNEAAIHCARDRVLEINETHIETALVALRSRGKEGNKKQKQLGFRIGYDEAFVDITT